MVNEGQGDRGKGGLGSAVRLQGNCGLLAVLESRPVVQLPVNTFRDPKLNPHSRAVLAWKPHVVLLAPTWAVVFTGLPPMRPPRPPALLSCSDGLLISSPVGTDSCSQSSHKCRSTNHLGHSHQTFPDLMVADNKVASSWICVCQTFM
jgi:hypothetical protein